MCISQSTCTPVPPKNRCQAEIHQALGQRQQLETGVLKVHIHCGRNCSKKTRCKAFALQAKVQSWQICMCLINGGGNRIPHMNIETWLQHNGVHANIWVQGAFWIKRSVPLRKCGLPMILNLCSSWWQKGEMVSRGHACQDVRVGGWRTFHQPVDLLSDCGVSSLSLGRVGMDSKEGQSEFSTSINHRHHFSA